MRNAIRMALVISLFLGASAGCAWLQKNGGTVLATIGCAVNTARDIANAVHSGQQGSWFDTATQGFAGASDALSCANNVRLLVQSAHGCADASGASCDAIPYDEQKRLDQCMTIAQAMVRLRSQRMLK